jgi:rubrerythrin
MESNVILFENVIGETKGTALERIVKQNFQGETSEVGIYLAMARLAQRQGFGEIAELLKNIAWEEAEHASRFAEFNGLIQEDIFDNIKQMLEGEVFASNSKKEAGDKAKDSGLESAMNYFYESAKDEARHARILDGILKHYDN